MFIQPALILSRVFAERFEPLLNVGIDIDTADPGRSIVRWAAGMTALVIPRLTAAIVFLGRHELAPQTDPIDFPFFFQIERNDLFDASVGLRYRFGASGAVSVNALVPMNDQGLRAPVIPTGAIEYVF